MYTVDEDYSSNEETRNKCMSDCPELHGARQLSLQREKMELRIPDLQFDLFSIDVDHTCSKLHTYCEVVHGLEPLVGKLKEET